MIAYGYMQDNLQRLDRLYRRARSPKEALFYSKLAILELCGWIEESMDDVVVRCSVRCLKELSNRTLVTAEIVKKNYGFHYEKHFRSMMMRIVGLAQVENIERKVDAAKHARFTATLGSLHVVRNAQAHTHLKGVTRTMNAPSVTFTQFQHVYEGLTEYDRVLRKFIA